MQTTLHHQSYHTPVSSYNDAIYEVRPADLPSLIAYRLLINHPNPRFLVKHQRQKNKPLTLRTAIILPFMLSRWWSATNVALNPKKTKPWFIASAEDLSTNSNLIKNTNIVFGSRLRRCIWLFIPQLFANLQQFRPPTKTILPFTQKYANKAMLNE